MATQNRGFPIPLTLIVAVTTLLGLRTNVLHCDANCLGPCRPTVFRRNVFFEMTVVAQKIIRPNVFRPTGFSPNRLHPIWSDLESPINEVRLADLETQRINKILAYICS